MKFISILHLPKKLEYKDLDIKKFIHSLNEYSKIHSKDNLTNARLQCILFKIVHSNETITCKHSIN